MRNKGHLLLSTLLLVCCLAVSIAAQGDKKKKGVAATELGQAVPIVTLMKAVQQGDYHRYLSILPAETVKTYHGRQKDWPKIRDQWKRRFDDDLGKYWFNDLLFVIGDESPERTEVFIVQKEKRKTRFKVKKEAGQWKLLSVA